MDFSAMFISVGSIAVMCLVIGQLCKLIPALPTKAIPVIVAFFGGVLGFVGFALGIPQLATLTIFDAIATGIVSGIASSGAFSLYKNLTNQYEGNS